MNFFRLPTILSVCCLVTLSAGAAGQGTAPAAPNEGVRDGQTLPLSPEESLQRMQLDGPYEAECVAAEPLVLDPVECTWDARGRLFVADMRDYPLGPAGAGAPWLSRIQLLHDDDGDGRMDRATTWADHLDHVQGLLPYRDGLIATTRTQILFLRDTDGDDKADVSKPLIAGMNPRHSQLQVSAPRWGRDFRVYFNNGLDAKEIYPSDQPQSVVNVPRSNFRWDPRTGAIEATSGYGQYGGAFDDFGHHFFCSNRNPVMFAVMQHEAVRRNPYAGIEKGYEDIAPAGAETRVFPLQITHTTSDAHAGTNTACSGLGVYRGTLMPELRNDVFVPDPTGQLITRYRIAPNGASLKATRVGERTEFFRSNDEWCRPVNITTGPDGAIYVCDIYRRWIDHARFFPESFAKTHDLRQGEHHGRIWRIRPKGVRVPKIEAAPTDEAALRQWLEHPNAWQRETAGRLLMESGAPLAIPNDHGEALVEPNRKRFFEILQRPDTSDDIDAAEIEKRAASILESPEDEWMAKAVLASSARSCGSVLARVLADVRYVEQHSVVRSRVILSFATASSAAGHGPDFARMLGALHVSPGRLTWWKPPLLEGLAVGIPKSGGKWGARSLGEWVAKAPTPHQDAARKIGALMALMDAALSGTAPDETLRLACLPLLSQRKWEDAEPILRELFSPRQSAALQGGALAILRRFGAEKGAGLVYTLLPTAGPALRRDLVSLLTANPRTALDLFQRMEKGEISPALVDVETQWRYQQGTGELRDLAVRLFARTSDDRAAVLAGYLACAKMPGDAQRGRQVFTTICTTCHRIGDVGVEVGPSLADVRVKPPEALLSDILDPNRMFEARWSAYQVEMEDGQTLIGLITAEDQESVVLTIMGGRRETLSRRAIKQMKSLDRSLMPPGLEAAISKEQMADLLAYLRGL